MLGRVLEAIPQDAPNPVLPEYRTLRARLIEAGGDTEYADTPDENPPASFKADKKAAVANTVEDRPGWKASVLSRFKPLLEAIPVEAAAVLEAFNTLKKSVSSARPGAREVIE